MGAMSGSCWHLLQWSCSYLCIGWVKAGTIIKTTKALISTPTVHWELQAVFPSEGGTCSFFIQTALNEWSDCIVFKMWQPVQGRGSPSHYHRVSGQGVNGEWAGTGYTLNTDTCFKVNVAFKPPACTMHTQLNLLTCRFKSIATGCIQLHQLWNHNTKTIMTLHWHSKWQI